MIQENDIDAQLEHVLERTDFPELGEKYKGKVRDNYTHGNRRILIATDRISAFDHVITTIPFKGQVLGKLSSFWFERTKDIIGNHAIDFPDPNVIVALLCTALKVEMVVRGYITGVTNTSAWYHYERGKRDFCGNRLPDGLRKNQKFENPIITPSTKAEHGEHDESVSRNEILKRDILTEDQWNFIAQSILALYQRGVDVCAQQGVILVDTKYELGIDPDGNIILIDEIHTPDSSRFWLADEYEKRFASGQEQKKLDKEYLREWLAGHGFTGEGVIPQVPDDIRIETSRRYIKAFELITGQTFTANVGNEIARIRENLSKYFNHSNGNY